MQKRILSLTLALVLVFALACPALAVPTQNDPIIVIPGYTATQLFSSPADPADRTLVWNPDFNDIGQELLNELPGLLGGGLIYAVTGWNKIIVDAFSRAAGRFLDKFVINPDGTRKHDVGPWPGTAADFSLASIRAKTADDPNARYLSQLGSFCRRFESQVGAQNIFIFQYEWRDPTLRSSESLRTFIDEVLALTGKSRVRLFGSSYGGQVCGAYLHDYAQEGKVSKVVMEFPALGGSSMIPGLLTGENFSIQIETFTRFIQSYMDTEMKLDPILKWLSLKLLYPLATDLLQAGLLPIAKTWGSLWDLIPAKEYDATKAAVLQPDEHYDWEAYCDRMHHEVMPGIGKTLQDAQEVHGIEIRIVANTGSPHLLGASDINSDSILDVQYTTGAKALPLGKHGITQSYSICTDTGHTHVSPGQDIDASAAWLPDHTWFVQGQYHGSSYMDPYALELECALMMGENVNTVFDDPAYPQFGQCRQPTEGLALHFNGSALHVENLSRERDAQLLSICAPGLKFEKLPGGRLKPGEAITIACTESKAQPGAYVPVTVSYLQFNGNLPVPLCKTFDYTQGGTSP